MILDPEDAGLTGPIKKVRGLGTTWLITHFTIVTRLWHIMVQDCTNGHDPSPLRCPLICWNCEEEEGHVKAKCPYELRAFTQDHLPLGPKVPKKTGRNQASLDQAASPSS